MKKSLLLAILLFCGFIQGAFGQNTTLKDLRVSKSKAEAMIGRFSNDKELFKISREDLMQLAANSKAENDTFVFYLVRINEADEEQFVKKYKKSKKDKLSPNDVGALKDNWDKVKAKQPTSVLVGFLPGAKSTTSSLFNLLPWRKGIAVYDMAVVCPPPPDCDCPIE